MCVRVRVWRLLTRREERAAGKSRRERREQQTDSGCTDCSPPPLLSGCRQLPDEGGSARRLSLSLFPVWCAPVQLMPFLSLLRPLLGPAPGTAAASASSSSSGAVLAAQTRALHLLSHFSVRRVRDGVFCCFLSPPLTLNECTDRLSIIINPLPLRSGPVSGERDREQCLPLSSCTCMVLYFWGRGEECRTRSSASPLCAGNRSIDRP